MKSMYPNSPTSAKQPVLPEGFFPLVAGRAVNWESGSVCEKSRFFLHQKPRAWQVKSLLPTQSQKQIILCMNFFIKFICKEFMRINYIKIKSYSKIWKTNLHKFLALCWKKFQRIFCFLKRNFKCKRSCKGSTAIFFISRFFSHYSRRSGVKFLRYVRLFLRATHRHYIHRLRLPAHVTGKICVVESVRLRWVSCW